MNPIAIGSRLPEFRLPDQNKNLVNRSAIVGRPVLFSFHPLAWTGVCTRQMEALEMNAGEIATLGAVAFGVSVDPVPSKKAWAESLHIERTSLLSDFWPHGAFASALGLFRDKEGTSERAAVVIDRDGIVRLIKVYPIGEVPNIDEQIEILNRL